MVNNMNDSGNELYEWRDGRNKRIYFIKINGRLYQNVICTQRDLGFTINTNDIRTHERTIEWSRSRLYYIYGYRLTTHAPIYTHITMVASRPSDCLLGITHIETWMPNVSAQYSTCTLRNTFIRSFLLRSRIAYCCKYKTSTHGKIGNVIKMWLCIPYVFAFLPMGWEWILILKEAKKNQWNKTRNNNRTVCHSTTREKNTHTKK